LLDWGGVEAAGDIGIHPQNRQALCDFTEYWHARRPQVFKFMSTGLFKNASLLAVLIAAVIYLTSILSPPSLMDDSDAVEAQIARTMLTSGDFVTARLDGVVYLEKTPLPWWLMDIFRPRLVRLAWRG
jgi:hypothetical protein